MFVYSLLQSVFYFGGYELAGSAEVDPDLVCFETGLLLMILVMCCWVAAVILLMCL